MLYWLTEFSDGGDVFNLFRYITFRAGAAFATSLIFGFLFGQPLIDFGRQHHLDGDRLRHRGGFLRRLPGKQLGPSRFLLARLPGKLAHDGSRGTARQIGQDRLNFLRRGQRM